jgi:hypothetical protein
VSISLLAAQAHGQEIFGSKFTHQLTPPEACSNNKSKMCTWVMEEAQKNVGKETAPRNGRIAKIRLVACAPGSTFVLQIARFNAGKSKARVLLTGPLINYKGSTRNCTVSANFDIETFNVDVPVRKGDSLAVAATQVRFMYNSGSGPSQVFDPPLPDGGKNRAPKDGSGFLMIQAEMAPP